MSGEESVRRAGSRLLLLAGVAFALAILPEPASAVVCANVTAETGIDTDQDGFTDHQECTSIATLGTSPRTFHSCQTAEGAAQAPACLDPDVKDVFVIVAPAASGSLLPADGSGQTFNAFAAQTFYGVNFNGLSALGLRVHQLRPEEAHVDRFVAAAVAGLPQMKAVKVTESLNVSGSILGYCQYGTPLGLDGCVVYTQRTRDFIASSCGSAAIWTAGTTSTSSTLSSLDDVLKAYSTYLILHETGHSLGGLTAEYNSRFGGYHYKPGAGMVMEQAVTYSVKAGKCIFYISPAWNQTLDPPAVKLK